MKINKRRRRHLPASAGDWKAGLARRELSAEQDRGAAPSNGSSQAAPSKGAGQFATAVVANDTLTITGTNGPDNISFALNGSDPNTLDVDLDNNGFPDVQFDRNTFSAIAVFLQGGDDTFAVTGTTSPDEALSVDGGSGDDTITTGSGNDLIFGGDGRDTINSGAGDDTIDAGSGDDAVVGGVGHDTAFASGNDSFVWNPGEGSDFVAGDSSYDTLVFNARGRRADEFLGQRSPLGVLVTRGHGPRRDQELRHTLAVRTRSRSTT